MMVTYLVLVYLVGIPLFLLTTGKYRRETNQSDLMVALLWPLVLVLFFLKSSP